ncbi:hypothetical protein MAR_020790 [Mya arenaria]|uniref:Uncharacterized protein n=1 Tax=Mya arenaria TaxID=6604 RepID=A0ABY7E931_MYAAR|nr:hypothetical protein MAR_020790 [Mya arenaria]
MLTDRTVQDPILALPVPSRPCVPDRNTYHISDIEAPDGVPMLTVRTVQNPTRAYLRPMRPPTHCLDVELKYPVGHSSDLTVRPRSQTRYWAETETPGLMARLLNWAQRLFGRGVGKKNLGVTMSVEAQYSLEKQESYIRLISRNTILPSMLGHSNLYLQHIDTLKWMSHVVEVPARVMSSPDTLGGPLQATNHYHVIGPGVQEMPD